LQNKILDLNKRFHIDKIYLKKIKNLHKNYKVLSQLFNHKRIKCKMINNKIHMKQMNKFMNQISRV